jgi:hypothetical protein
VHGFAIGRFPGFFSFRSFAFGAKDVFFVRTISPQRGREGNQSGQKNSVNLLCHI